MMSSPLLGDEPAAKVDTPNRRPCLTTHNADPNREVAAARLRQTCASFACSPLVRATSGSRRYAQFERERDMLCSFC